MKQCEIARAYVCVYVSLSYSLFLCVCRAILFLRSLFITILSVLCQFAVAVNKLKQEQH